MCDDNLKLKQAIVNRNPQPVSGSTSFMGTTTSCTAAERTLLLLLQDDICCFGLDTDVGIQEGQIDEPLEVTLNADKYDSLFGGLNIRSYSRNHYDTISNKRQRDTLPASIQVATLTTGSGITDDSHYSLSSDILDIDGTDWIMFPSDGSNDFQALYKDNSTGDTRDVAMLPMTEDDCLNTPPAKIWKAKRFRNVSRNKNISLVCMPSSASTATTIDDSVVQLSYEQQCMAYNNSDEEDESNHLDNANNEPNPNPPINSNTIYTNGQSSFYQLMQQKGSIREQDLLLRSNRQQLHRLMYGQTMGIHH
jgi:hypothetical protein